MTAPFTTLRRYLPGKRVERCALCGTPLPPDHPHLLEIAAQRAICACEACGLLFYHRTNTYRRIGRDVRCLPDFQMTDAEWDSLMIPIGLAYFVFSTPAARVMAFYPGPAGSTESLLPLASWSQIAAQNPALQHMEPDTEALLVNRIGRSRDYYLAPVDCCHRLAGLIRVHWRGLSGGDEVWREIGNFFDQLKEASRA